MIRRLRLLDPAGEDAVLTPYGYDDAERLAEVVNLEAEYNELRAMTRLAEPTGAVWRWSYDEVGNLLSATDPAGATRYEYDDRGHLRSVTDALGNVRAIETDPAGLAVRVADPVGATSRYVRDVFVEV